MQQQASQAFCRHLLRLATHKHFRNETGTIVIGGYHVVTEYIRNQNTSYTLAITQRYLDRHPEFIQSIQKDTPLFLMEEAKMARILKEPHPEGILATVPFPSTKGVPFDQNHRRSLWLYGPFRDPGNVGTLARSALAFGFSQIILSDPTSVDHLHPITIRASKGALLYTPIVTSFSPSMVDYSKTSLIIGDVGGIPLDQYQMMNKEAKDRLILVLGSESHGLSALPDHLRSRSDCVSIPTSIKMPYLNVATAGSILMQSLR